MRVPGTAFTAKYPGTCISCNLKYGPGMVIVSRGKGLGAMHKGCWDRSGVVTRAMTQEDRDHLRDLKRRHRVAKGPGSDIW